MSFATPAEDSRETSVAENGSSKEKTRAGRLLQVIFIFPKDDEIDVDSLAVADLIDYSAGRGKVIYVIHAMQI